MSETGQSNDANQSLKVNIEGRTLLKIKGLIFPVNPFVLSYGYIRNNLLDINLWCTTCMVEHNSRRAIYYCETEKTYVCAVCNGFCFMKAHTWKDLYCYVEAKGQQ